MTGKGSRWKVISRAVSYHGNTAGALTLSGDANAHKMYGPMIKEMPKVPTPFSYRVPPNYTPETYARHCATERSHCTRCSYMPSALL